MGKKNYKMRKNKNTVEYEDYGNAEFHCPFCGHYFEVPWMDIFDLQECTHGFVGWHLNDVYIACPKCDKNANTEY